MSHALMYVSNHDPGARVAIWRFRGEPTPDEWTQHLADMDVVATWSVEAPRACVLIEVSDFAPTAKQRADIALHSGVRGYQPLIAFVTTHAFLRGALRAIAWLQGPQRYEAEFFADVHCAIGWLEKRSERSLSRMQALRSRSDTDSRGKPLSNPRRGDVPR